MLRKALYSMFRKRVLPRIASSKIFTKSLPIVKGQVKQKSWLHSFLARQALKDSDYEEYPIPDGSITDQNWDNLIIMDACRYDIFNELYSCEKRISRGTTTSEWLKANFKDKHEDIVYVSSNPRVSSIEFDGFKATDHFFHVENVWEYGWDDELDTVPPEEITKAVIRMKEEYSDKRIVAHYMQPHLPFIGDEEIDFPGKYDEPGVKTIFDSLALGEVSKDEAWEGYRSNLKLVKKEVDKLIGELDGKIWLTSDHGNSFGPLFYAHPSSIRIKQLVEVPLLIYNRDKKRTGETGTDASEAGTVEKEEVREKLKKLGYLE